MSKAVQHRFLLQFLEADGTIKSLVLLNQLNLTNLLSETMGATLMNKMFLLFADFCSEMVMTLRGPNFDLLPPSSGQACTKGGKRPPPPIN